MFVASFWISRLIGDFKIISDCLSSIYISIFPYCETDSSTFGVLFGILITV